MLFRHVRLSVRLREVVLVAQLFKDIKSTGGFSLNHFMLFVSDRVYIASKYFVACCHFRLLLPFQTNQVNADI